MPNWIQWHTKYEDLSSSLSRRLAVVRKRIAEALDQLPQGNIRAVSMCAGDGRDLLGVLADHPRARDVSGRLVELNPQLAERARASATRGSPTPMKEPFPWNFYCAVGYWETSARKTFTGQLNHGPCFVHRMQS